MKDVTKEIDLENESYPNAPNGHTKEPKMSETLKAFAEAAYRLARAQAKRDVIQRSLDGIIAEQERRAAAKAATLKTKESEPPTNKNLR